MQCKTPTSVDLAGCIDVAPNTDGCVLPVEPTPNLKAKAVLSSFFSMGAVAAEVPWVEVEPNIDFGGSACAVVLVPKGDRAEGCEVAVVPNGLEALVPPNGLEEFVVPPVDPKLNANFVGAFGAVGVVVPVVPAADPNTLFPGCCPSS